LTYPQPAPYRLGLAQGRFKAPKNAGAWHDLAVDVPAETGLIQPHSPAEAGMIAEGRSRTLSPSPDRFLTILIRHLDFLVFCHFILTPMWLIPTDYADCGSCQD